MALPDDARVRDIVRERYGELARQSASGSAPRAADLRPDDALDLDVSLVYSAEQTTGLPEEALAASAGCGNPHAIASLRRGETVVDFGSGGGIDCFIAARAVGQQGRVVGIDMTGEMVELARSNARRLGLGNVEFHLSQMEETPLEDGTVDATHLQLRDQPGAGQGHRLPRGPPHPQAGRQADGLRSGQGR